MSIFESLFRKKNIESIYAHQDSMKRILSVWDLTAFGVAAILGAGIFSTIGNAASNGGPAVVILFVFTAVACGFSAICYAEFASRVPISGSAYTYAYISFGELLAWIIGWDLLMEYAIGNIAVSLSWSQYFVNLLDSYHIKIPPYLVSNYFTAQKGFQQMSAHLLDSKSSLYQSYLAWVSAPQLFGLKVIFDLPNILITVFITVIVYLGIKESRVISNTLVVLKVLVVLIVIGSGIPYIQPDHWKPFAPEGLSGILKGVSAIFFAYIGFDAISTTAEECKDPQKDLPRAMFYSLIVCTTLYAVITFVLTGIVHYSKLRVGDPLAFVFGPQGANLPWVCHIVQLGAVIALSTVLLVYQLGQPRIWMAMSRDGLLPPIFSALHPKYRTPWFSTILTAVVVIVPSFFLTLSEVTDLASIGTLCSFMIVCGGILILNPHGKPLGRFVTPYVNSRWILAPLVVVTLALLYWIHPSVLVDFLKLNEPLINQVPSILFLMFLLLMCFLTFLYELSLIPVLGLLSCAYLLAEIGIWSWVRFTIWLIVGLMIYFAYGFRKSRLRKIN
jgi:APA family basic amino acid/polyamine antiporter